MPQPSGLANRQVDEWSCAVSLLKNEKAALRRPLSAVPVFSDVRLIGVDRPHAESPDNHGERHDGDQHHQAYGEHRA
jgi:hypothetical protein